jgi:RNA polymerase sigma factor (sigma-70 family)
VTEHGRAVMRVCRAWLGPADAEDAWSETFVSALRAYPRLRPDSNARAWLVTIAHHKAIDVIRARTRRPLPTGRQTDIPIADPTPLDEELRAALDALPVKQRGAVIYRYLADLSYDDIGELLGCSAPAARRSASDGIANLRKQYPKGPST